MKQLALILACLLLPSIALGDTIPTLDLASVRQRADELYNEDYEPAPQPPSGLQESGEQAEEETYEEIFEDIPKLKDTLNVRFEERVSSSTEPVQEFFPMVVMSATYCGPCKAVKKDHPDLAKKMIFLELDTPKGLTELRKLGIVGPGAEQHNVPKFYNFDPINDEYVQVASGYAGGTSEADFLTQVGSVGTFVEGPPVASRGLSEAFVVSPSGSSLEAVATVLAAHIGRNQPELAQSQLTGNAYDIEIDSLDVVPDLLLLLTRKQSYSVAGCTIDWSGDRDISISTGKVVVTPFPKVTLKKWLISVTVELRSITVSPDGRRVELELKGVPDLVINFT